MTLNCALMARENKVLPAIVFMNVDAASLSSDEVNISWEVSRGMVLVKK